jgi:hypothetical protein
MHFESVEPETLVFRTSNDGKLVDQYYRKSGWHNAQTVMEGEKVSLPRPIPISDLKEWKHCSTVPYGLNLRLPGTLYQIIFTHADQALGGQVKCIDSSEDIAKGIQAVERVLAGLEPEAPSEPTVSTIEGDVCGRYYTSIQWVDELTPEDREELFEDS